MKKIQMPLKFVQTGPIDKLASVQVMAWRRICEDFCDHMASLSRNVSINKIETRN